MTREVVTIGPDATVDEAVVLLLEHRIAALPVVEGTSIVGVVTLFDLARHLGDVVGAMPAARTVADLMTDRVFSVTPTDALDDVLDVMLEHGVRHVPVVDEDGTVVGVVSHRDLLGETAPRATQDEEGNLVNLVQSLSGRTVAQVMSAPEIVARDTPLAEAAAVLMENRFGCVPVVDNGHLVGILTESDFVRQAIDNE